MHTIAQYRQMVNDAIAAIAYPAQPANLYEPIAYTMGQSGKRIRPVLVLMACEAMGGDPKQALNAAIGLEMYHNFTLLHDDVMDRSDVRRGMPTVHRRWGENIAILSGDAMLTMATRLMTQVPDDKLPAVMRLFNNTALEIDEGQQWDIDFEHRNNVTVADYIEMIRLKTSVLLGCACKLGAIIAGAGEEQCQRLYDLGMNLGLAFQLQDDVLDVWGDAATFGKPIGGDIANNKKTFLLVSAINLAQGDDANELRRWVNDLEALPGEKIAAVTALYNKLGIRALAQEQMAAYNAKAAAALELLQLGTDATAAFNEMITSLMGRNK